MRNERGAVWVVPLVLLLGLLFLMVGSMLLASIGVPVGFHFGP